MALPRRDEMRIIAVPYPILKRMVNMLQHIAEHPVHFDGPALDRLLDDLEASYGLCGYEYERSDR
jgi:hypothetical protein